MTTRRQFTSGLAKFGLAAAAASMPGMALAQAAKWKVVANHRRGSSWSDRWPWFAEEVSKRSGGQFSLDLTTVPELGLNGAELLRLLRSNLVDMADVVAGYVSGELPLVEAVQLPTLFKDVDAVEKVHTAWLNDVLSKKENVFGGKLYSVCVYSTSFLVSRFPVKALSDFKGKKIRIFAPSQLDVFKSLGAEGVFIPSAEMYSALQLGTVDAVVTGPDQISGQKMADVAKYVIDMQLGVSPAYVVISRGSWTKLPAADKKILEALEPEFTKRGWDACKKNDKEGLDYARQNGMQVIVPAPTEWSEQLRQIGRDSVTPAWAKRAGPEGVAAFNKYLAPAVGFTAAS